MTKSCIIGLTGGIGSGKSVVSRILRLKGYPVYDCDSEAKHIMSVSRKILDSLCERFGEECVNEDGSLNRKHLSCRVFNNKEDLAWLNALVHSEVRTDFNEWVHKRGGVCFVESAILHTSHLDESCREIWLVEAPEDIRFYRAMQRGGIEETDLRLRMKTQTEEFQGLDKEKVRIIRNYGDNSLLGQISGLLKINNI